MLRHAAITFFVLITFAGAAWAESIGLQHNRRPRALESELNPLDPTFQNAVLEAADTDWRETHGADVWWLSFNGLTLHVQVLPALQHPGKQGSHCCVGFTVGDSEFALKVFSARPGTGGSTPSSDDSVGGEKTSNGPGWSPHDAPAWSLPALAGYPDIGGDAGEFADLQRFSIAEVTEPGSLLLLAIGLAAARQVRTRRLR